MTRLQLAAQRLEEDRLILLGVVTLRVGAAGNILGNAAPLQARATSAARDREEVQWEYKLDEEGQWQQYPASNHAVHTGFGGLEKGTVRGVRIEPEAALGACL